MRQSFSSVSKLFLIAVILIASLNPLNVGAVTTTSEGSAVADWKETARELKEKGAEAKKLKEKAREAKEKARELTEKASSSDPLLYEMY